MVEQLTRRKFSVAEYYQMAHAGILTEDDRVELIEGEVVQMTPIGPRHSACVTRLNRLLGRLFLDDAALVSVQNSIRLTDDSEPQPDLALLRPHSDLYALGHPEPNDVFLVVEVSDSSAETDRSVKVPLYARAGILEVWAIDLPEDRLTVWRDPSAGRYQTELTLQRGDHVAPGSFPDRELAVDNLIGG